MTNFFSLSLEIRNMIYGIVLLSSNPILVISSRLMKDEDRKRYDPNSTITHALMQANQQVYLEASQVFYSINTFKFGSKHYGSFQDENLHGLRAFIKRTTPSPSSLHQKSQY
jgi:hypothetical protein